MNGPRPNYSSDTVNRLDDFVDWCLIICCASIKVRSDYADGPFQ